MSVNSIILFPADTRLQDVATVAGILAGLPMQKEHIGENTWYCSCKGAKAKPTSIPEMAELTLSGPMFDGEVDHSATWHWESDNKHARSGERLLYPKANPFWVAVGIGLIKFFGGKMTYCDYDDKIDLTMPKRRKQNNPNNGKEWDDFQHEMAAVQPLTEADLKKANEHAAYKLQTD